MLFLCHILSVFIREQQIIAIPSVSENRYYSSLSEKSHHIFLASSHSKFLIEFLMVTKSCSHNYDGLCWVFWKVSLFWMWEWKKRTFELTEALHLIYLLKVWQPWVNIELQGCPSHAGMDLLPNAHRLCKPRFLGVIKISLSWRVWSWLPFFKYM